jgi:hypothetical protein
MGHLTGEFLLAQKANQRSKFYWHKNQPNKFYWHKNQPNELITVQQDFFDEFFTHAQRHRKCTLVPFDGMVGLFGTKKTTI